MHSILICTVDSESHSSSAAATGTDSMPQQNDEGVFNL